MLQNEWQPNILDRLYQIMFKIIIRSQIGADRYQKPIFEIVLLSPPPWRIVPWIGRRSSNLMAESITFDGMCLIWSDLQFYPHKILRREIRAC